MTILRFRTPAGAACLVAGFILGACASDDDSGQPGTTSTTTTNLVPAAGVDPNADGVITGPINDARRVAEEAEKRQEEQEQQQEPAPAPRQQSDPDMSR